MIRTYVLLIMNGKRRFSSIPGPLKEKVKEELINTLGKVKAEELLQA